MCPFAVFVAELSAHVRRAATFITFAAVFFPKKRQRNAGLCELTVDIRIIGLNVSADFLVLVREKDPFQFGVGNILVKGPVDICLATSNTLRIVWREQRALSAILR